MLLRQNKTIMGQGSFLPTYFYLQQLLALCIAQFEAPLILVVNIHINNNVEVGRKSFKKVVINAKLLYNIYVLYLIEYGGNMPTELKKYFWDTEFEKLDLEKNKRYIISRLYCYGDLKAIKWIKHTYTNKDIKEVAKKSRNLNPLVANYLRQQFNLKKEEMMYYKMTKALNYEFGRENY